MDEKAKKELEQIIAKMECPKDFQCYRSGLEALCKAKDLGLKSFLECLQETSEECNFSAHLEYFYLCQCPARIYIAKHFPK